MQYQLFNHQPFLLTPSFYQSFLFSIVASIYLQISAYTPEFILEKRDFLGYYSV